MNLNQKKIEKRDVSLFLKYANIKYSHLSCPAQDPPDIIVHQPDDKIIAIEHRRLEINNGNKINNIYHTYDRIIGLAKEHYERDGKPAINVYFEFNGILDTRKGKDRLLAIQISEIITKFTSDNKKVETLIKIPYDELPENIEEITIILNKHSTINNWSRNKLFLAGELESTTLIPQIQVKNERLKVTKYNRDYNETWLLLVVEGEPWSEFSIYKPNNFEVDEKWEFDHIYIYGRFNNKIEQLK